MRRTRTCLLLAALVAATSTAAAHADTYWFVCDKGSICRAEGDGDDRRRVVLRPRPLDPPNPFGPPMLSSFAVTPDERVAFASDGNRLFRLDLRRGRTRDLEGATPYCCSTRVYGFDPSGRRVLFRRSKVTDTHELCLATRSGRVVRCEDLSHLSQPGWGPRLRTADVHDEPDGADHVCLRGSMCVTALAREDPGWDIEGSPLLSRDERSLLVEAHSSSRTRIDLFATRTGRRIRTLFESDTSWWGAPFWAPGGRAVLRALVVERWNEPRGVEHPERTAVLRIPLRGGPERQVAEVAGELLAVTR